MWDPTASPPIILDPISAGTISQAEALTEGGGTAETWFAFFL